MSVIIRLQNLPWSANALDIRQYFQGLSIPEGGVHIVGGELGDAFIAFSTDEDARQAFTRNNGKIKEIQITLMLSSRTEMQRVIEQARSQSYAAFMQPAPSIVPLPAAVPSIIPQVIDLNKESKDKEKSEKRESRRKSRSRSRDRKDRSKDRSRDRRDRRHRRSRSRSRDRKSSRRRDRSRSRGRSRSRDRKSKEYRKRSEERVPFQRKSLPDVWNKQNSLDIPSASSPKLMGNFPLSAPNRSVDNMKTGFPMQANNGMHNMPNFPRSTRDSWPPSSTNNMDNNFQNSRVGLNFRERDNQDVFPNRFQRGNVPNHRGGHRADEPDCSIALEPFHGGYGEVRRFFQGLFINGNGIKFINDQNGRSTGVVFVRFTNRSFKEEAQSMTGEILNGIPVTISHIGDEEFDRAIDRYNPRKQDDHNDNLHFKNKHFNSKFSNVSDNDLELDDFTCLTVDDLPTYCKEQDILHMFSQHPLVALILTTKKKGGFIAYVKFGSKEIAKKALLERSLHIVGGKQVSVRPCKDEDFDEINKRHDVNLNSSKSEDIGTDCLSISRLPEKTNDKDIADFFSDIGVIPIKIHLMSNSLGFTGQAYCEFASSDEATRAARKHDTSLGNVSVSVLPIKRVEMENILGTTVPAPEPEDSIDLTVQSTDDSFSPILNLPSLSNFPSSEPRPILASHQLESRGPRFGARAVGPRPPRFTPPRDVFEDVPPGCTIFMKNVPYKANTSDILNFFDGFNHTSNVSRRYNANNMPTDEAKIIFFDPEEASRAMRDLQKLKIWDRQIFLKQE